MAVLIESEPPGITKTWAEFASTLSYDDLPPAVIRSAKSLVADTVAVMLGASGLDRACGLVQQVAGPGSGAPESTLIGYGRRAPVLLAALVNGSTAHALNYDAVGGGGGHVGVASVPAPLALAERKGGVSGRRLLVAVSVGAEFGARLVESISTAPSSPKVRFSSPQLFGYFAVAVAGGHVLDLKPAQMNSALGLALMQAAGGSQPSSEGKEAKGLYGGLFNYGGVLSALLAAEGIDAECLALEGDRGLFQAFFGGRYEPSALEDGLGTVFRGADARFKVWPTSGALHPFVDAAVGIARQQGFNAREIDQIVVKAPPHIRIWAEPVDERRHPQNIATATNSLFFAVAAALANGDFTLSDLTERGLVEEEVMRLTEACDWVPSDEKDAAIEITFKDGTRNAVRVSWSHKDRVKPGYEHIQTKFRDCARHAAVALEEERVEKVLQLLERLEDLEDIRTLTDLLVARP